MITGLLTVMVREQSLLHSIYKDDSSFTSPSRCVKLVFLYVVENIKGVIATSAESGIQSIREGDRPYNFWFAIHYGIEIQIKYPQLL